MKLNKYWFKPRRFGYGATPTTWEGWVVVLAFMAYLLAISSFMTEDVTFYAVAGIIAIFVISKKKTDGEWKWSWGKI